MARNQPPIGARLAQRGSALISSLMILILIMIIGTTSMSISDIQFKLAGNLQFSTNAMANAEVSIAEGESWLTTGTNYLTAFATYDASKPYIYPIGQAIGNPLTITWDDSNSKMVTGDTSGNKRYMIQMLERNVKLIGDDISTGGRKSTACAQVNTYQITARGASARGTTKFIQTNYSVLSC